MRFLANVALVTLVCIFSGCAQTNDELKVDGIGQANPWTHLNLNNNPDNFQFAIVADRTGKHRPGVFAQAVTKLNLLNPQFVISIGDLIEGGSDDEAELNTQWNEFEALVTTLKMPFFHVAGNHDINNQATARIWKKRFGPSYYHFVYRNVLFLCLNTEDADRSHITDEQFEYFRRVIKANNNVRWTLVFLHKPLWWNPETLEYWQKFLTMLGQRQYTVFAGHRHTYSKDVYDGREYYILAKTGAGDEPTGLDECKFDHVVWVTVTDNGPVIANLLLEAILDDEPCPQ